MDGWEERQMEGRVGFLKIMWKNCQRSNLVNLTFSVVFLGIKFRNEDISIIYMYMYCLEIKLMFVWYFVILNIMCYSVDDICISCYLDMLNNQKVVQYFIIYLLFGVC